MNFMDLFLPMTAAVITASIVVAVLHFLLGRWLSKRQNARVEKYYKEMAEKMGISPEDFISQMEEHMNSMGGMGMVEGPPGMMGGPMGNVMTTTSGGGEGQVDGTGQYL